MPEPGKPEALKRGDSAKPGMLKRQSTGALKERARIRALAKQDTRGQLIAAAKEREALDKATAGPKLITDAKPNEDRKYRPPEKKPTKVGTRAGKRQKRPLPPQPPGQHPP